MIYFEYKEIIMKKFVAVVVSIAMLMAMSMAVMAEFISSPPAGGEEPEFTEFIVTPYSEIGDAHEDVDTDGLKDAHDELKNTDDLSDLVDGVKENSVVREIYDVTVEDELKDTVFNDGAKELTLDLGIKDGNFQIIFCGENGWKLFENYKDNGDGTVTLTVSELGVFAILVAGTDDGGNEQPPQTSDPMYAIVAVMAVSALATAVVASKKHKA